jgi:hypothetical protein
MKNKYVVVSDCDEVCDVVFTKRTDADQHARCLLEEHNGDEFFEVFELVPVAKFKLVATLVKD